MYSTFTFVHVAYVRIHNVLVHNNYLQPLTFMVTHISVGDNSKECDVKYTLCTLCNALFRYHL